MDSSDYLEFLNTRCSVREYSDEEIRDEEITYLLDCVTTAPSAGNLEAWDTVLQDSRRSGLLAGNPGDT